MSENQDNLPAESPYAEAYSDAGFWEKARKYARSAGEAVLDPALQMYYATQDKDTPIWAKTAAYGALGYFISLVDAIPDITPVVGYSDDLGVIVAALATIGAHVKPEHKEKAREKIKGWFGET